jgi:arylsulfatase A-like enzyme
VNAGLSLLPVLAGSARSVREAVPVSHEYGPVRAIRTAQWKYVVRFGQGPAELYNLDDDPQECVNLAGNPTHRARENELAELMRAWFDRRTIPNRDGSHQPVSGRGQLIPLGDAATARGFYHPGNGERRIPR